MDASYRSYLQATFVFYLLLATNGNVIAFKISDIRGYCTKTRDYRLSLLTQ